MQVYSKKFINDDKSVLLGVKKIINAYNLYFENPPENIYEHSIKWYIIEHYNVGYSYQNEVSELADIIKETFYKETADTLQQENNKEND